MRGCLCGFLLLIFSAAAARAGEVVDVSRQWKEHISSSPAAAQNPVSVPRSSAPAPSVQESTVTIPSDCGCESMTVPEKLSQASCAFTGVVEAVAAPKKGRQKIVLDVDETFKGSPKPDMEIATDVAGTPCDLSFEEGKKYLIYARWEWGSYVTSRCMGTKLVETARGDASALGPSEALKEKFYIHLRNACMGRMDTVCCLSSLKAMRANYYVPKPEGGCPEGTIPDRLSCAGSYEWCIPISEGERRHIPAQSGL